MFCQIKFTLLINCKLKVKTEKIAKSSWAIILTGFSFILSFNEYFKTWICKLKQLDYNKTNR